MKDQVELLSEMIGAARTWARTRINLRRVHDSKSATDADRKRAHREHVAASNALEKAVIALSKAIPPSSLRARKALDWGKIAGVVAQIAGGIERAVQVYPNPIEAEVIDVEGRTVSK